MSKFLQLCFVFLAVIAAVVLEASANEAAISDYYYDDYDLYSYDDVVDALYSDQGKEALGSTGIQQTLSLGTVSAEALLPSESRQRPQKRKKRPKGQKRQKQQEFAKENRQVSAKQLNNQLYLVAI